VVEQANINTRKIYTLKIFIVSVKCSCCLNDFRNVKLCKWTDCIVKCNAGVRELQAGVIITLHTEEKPAKHARARLTSISYRIIIYDLLLQSLHIVQASHPYSSV